MQKKLIIKEVILHLDVDDATLDSLKKQIEYCENFALEQGLGNLMLETKIFTGWYGEDSECRISVTGKRQETDLEYSTCFC